MLILPIKKKWFDMIVSGEKKEEYREIKPYYDSRFMNAFGFLLAGGQMVYGEAAPEEIRKPWPVPVVFRNGYSKDSPEIVCECTLQFGEGPLPKIFPPGIFVPRASATKCMLLYL